MRLFFVADPEEGGFEDIQMPFAHQRFKETKEEGDHEIADVEAVDIGIGGEDDLAVAKVVEVFFDLKGLHEVIDFDVFVEGVAVEVANIEGFAFEGEDRLVVGIAAADERAGGGLAFGDEDLGVEMFLFDPVEVVFAVFELGDADGNGFGALAGEFFHGVEFFAKFLGLFDFGNQFFGFGGVAVERLGGGLCDAGDEVGANFAIAEFVFGLAFEDGFFEANGNGAEDALADVVAGEFFIGEIVDAAEEAFAEGGEVGTAVGGVLSVHEGVVLFGEAVCVGEGEFEGGVVEVEGGIYFFELAFVGDEVEEAAAAVEEFAVKPDFQLGIKIGIEA